MNAKLKITDKIETNKSIDGTFTYIYGDLKDCKIVINKNSKNPSQILMHECIHNALSKMETIPEVEKLAHRMNRREDFIYILSVYLSKVIKFQIKEK